MIPASVYRNSFVTFARLCLKILFGEQIVTGSYVEYLLRNLEFQRSLYSWRTIINLPPRHLKTVIGYLLAAYELACRPSSEVMIVSGSDRLSRQARDALRKIIRAPKFRKTFGIQLVSDNASGLYTSEGGSICFFSIDGKFTGLGADMIIVDDLVEIGDARNLERLQKVNELFEAQVMTRFNNRAGARIVVIAHRLSENDLSGHLLESGVRWSHIKLALEAPEDECLHAGGYTFIRKKGELLRPDAFTEEDLISMRKQVRPVPFETVQQQNPGARPFKKLDASCFGSYQGGYSSTDPIVISVDPASATSSRSSFSVIQVWLISQGRFILLQQYRDRAEFVQLRDILFQLCRRNMPSIVLLEDNNNAAGLAAKLNDSKFNTQLIKVGKSKIERFALHVPTIRGGGILLGPGVDREIFVSELIGFPSGPYDDQVDATTLFLGYISKTPCPPPRRLRASGLVLRSGQGIVAPSHSNRAVILRY